MPTQKSKWVLRVVSLVSLALFAIGSTAVLFDRATQAAETLRDAPAITATQWLNSKPLLAEDLLGRVTLVEFWTLGCYNCKNVEPYVKQWHQRYRGDGLQVIAVHTPEFDYEKSLDTLRAYVDSHAIEYAIAVDNDFTIWNSYKNRYWPTMYLIDKRGSIRYVKIGEGNYAATERQLQALLRE